MKIGDGTPHFSIHIREYVPADLDACLDIFASNASTLSEGAGVLADFLMQGTSWFLVAERDGKVVAFGGLELDGESNRGSLVFGMVERSQQRCGIGTLLTLTRLTLTPEEDPTTMVTLETNVVAEPFYTRFGFERISPEKSNDAGATFVRLGLWVTKQTKQEIRQMLTTMPVSFAEGIMP